MSNIIDISNCNPEGEDGSIYNGWDISQYIRWALRNIWVDIHDRVRFTIALNSDSTLRHDSPNTITFMARNKK